MLNRSHIGAAILMGLGVLSGCASSGTSGKGDGGKKVGASILEEMNGGLIGGSIGSELSAHDRRSALEAEYKALEYTPSGQPVTWEDAGAGRHGVVVAGQPYQVGSQNCRQYTHTVYFGAAPKVAKGAACRNPDGSWTPLT